MKEYRKNELVEVEITDIGAGGEGIGRVEGFILFVKDAVPGDAVEARITKSKKNYAYARLEKVIAPSPFRVEPECAFHKQCGGCQLQAYDYVKQLEYKQNKIRDNLIRIGGFSAEFIDCRMEPIVGMEYPFRYRNKAQYPVGTDKAGNVVTGFYAGRTHTIISNTDCRLGVPENQQILDIILEHMRENHITAYDEKTGQGLVRHIMIRKGFATGELMVCLVINYKASKKTQKMTNTSKGILEEALEETSDKKNMRENFIPKQDELLKKLGEFPNMTSVSVSINAENTNVIMGSEIHNLWGADAISDIIHVRDMQTPGYPPTGTALNFKISPLSFYQVNPVQTEKLYSLALEYAGLTGQETVWDLYCGIGTISLFLAGYARQVYGVEVVEQAIWDARENARRNGIYNAAFFVGKAEELLPRYCRNEAGEETVPGEADHAGMPENAEIPGNTGTNSDMLHPDVIVVDPPRKGCDRACLDTMLKMQPERIVYVSCDSATLARDLKILCDGGYEIRRIRGVDQFGMTVHVETVCLLSNRKADSHIKLSLDMDEYYDIMEKEQAEKK